ncbi:PLC-like phosphodiesterase [Rhizodiscina lignyota]|uniref:PLC-like phosphodiesterase n=1 Tax=Rhizodiscina lignyota TaxID=1504668 RepID=A0A9P4IIE4_9PEZI|nr:PLC-like phosphodiesterase [Rhizodiscina lignyota]
MSRLVYSATLALFSLGSTLAYSYGSSQSQLAELALEKVLTDASPIFGVYQDGKKPTSTWMKNYPDDTPIVHMNIPGVHDTQTWNYSLATQQALDHITALDGEQMFPPEFFRCQEKPIISMLNDGIRAFDLRYAFDITNSTLVFYHSQALQSETATLEDVLFGYYQWLDDHPSEAVFVSLMYEGSTAIHAQNDAAVQHELVRTLTTDAAMKYLNPVKDHLGTLGAARGKITLFRRFDLDQLPASYTAEMPGLHFSPSNWTDNDPHIELVYNTKEHLTAYIEDFYDTNAPIGSPASLSIHWKYNATTANFLRAAHATGAKKDSLFWSFCSSEYTSNIPPETPKIQALGNGTLTPLGGVNQQLIPFFKSMKGKRLGIAMFDFYDQPSDLVQTFLDIQAPSHY